MFTTHNILEMSRIRQGKFKTNLKEIKISEKLETISKYFKDDFDFREIDFELKIEDRLKNMNIIIDEVRFGIVLYNLI